jgi:hypothetical protein
MKRQLILLVLGLLAAGLVVSTAVAKKPPKPGSTTTKTGVCHKGAGTSTTHPYVAIVVPTKAALSHHLRHPADVIVSSTIAGATPLPTGMTLKQFCRSLTPLTARGGGQLRSTNLTSTVTGLSGKLNVRLRLGQGQLCYSLTVTSPTSSVTVNSATLTQGTTVVSLTLPATHAGASPLTLTNCITLSRTTVESLLKGTTAITASVSTSAGTLTGTVS